MRSAAIARSCIEESKTAWREPRTLARYIAVSASRSRCSTRSVAGPPSAIPIEAPAKTSCPSIRCGGASERWTRSATAIASSALQPPGLRLAAGRHVEGRHEQGAPALEDHLVDRELEVVRFARGRPVSLDGRRSGALLRARAGIEPQIRRAQGEEPLSRPPVMAHGGLVHGQERAALRFLDPHRLRVVLEEDAIALLGRAERIEHPDALRDLPAEQQRCLLPVILHGARAHLQHRVEVAAGQDRLPAAAPPRRPPGGARGPPPAPDPEPPHTPPREAPTESGPGGCVLGCAAA